MNDPAQPSNPVRRRAPDGGRRRRAVQEMSPESRFVGYLVLGLGVLAFISVLILAFAGPDVSEEGPDPQVAGRLQTDMASQSRREEALDKAQLVLPRQKGVDMGDLQGSWMANIGPYVAVMQIGKGAYQIILARGEPEFPRLYSSGTISMIDDIAVMQPRADWKAPAAPAGSGIRYERLTRGSYPMIAGFKDDAMIWQNVPQGVETRTYVPPRSPLLLDPSRDYIVWKRQD